MAHIRTISEWIVVEQIIDVKKIGGAPSGFSSLKSTGPDGIYAALVNSQ